MYNISISPRAQSEIENAIEFYKLHSESAPKKFIIEISSAYAKLQSNPKLKLAYQNIRVINLRKFPFSLYFTLNEEENKIRILACFHNKKNPDKRP